MSNKENSYFTFLLDTIKNIQDAEYQERVWIRAEGPECNDFGDTVNDFFDYYNGIEDFENKFTEYGINIDQFILIKDLYGQLKGYCEIIPISPNDKEILADPRWKRIRDFAKVVYANLAKSG